MKEIQYKNITWIDFENPSGDDILYLRNTFNIHPLAIEEFATPTLRPKATQYEGCVYLTVHIPLFNVEKRTTYPGELDIVLTKTHLITGHCDSIYQLTEFFNTLEKGEAPRRQFMNKQPADLLYSILKILIESCFPKLDHIINNLDHIEEEIFKGNEKEMVVEISLVKRDILNFRRTLKPQHSVLESITQMKATDIIPSEIRPYFQDLIGTNIRLWNTLESTKETIESLEETNNSLLSNKLNQTMKVLTTLSAIIMPMSVYAWIMGIGIGTDIPFGKHPHAFWIHLGIMTFIWLVTIISFRLRKWL